MQINESRQFPITLSKTGCNGAVSATALQWLVRDPRAAAAILPTPTKGPNWTLLFPSLNEYKN